MHRVALALGTVTTRAVLQVHLVSLRLGAARLHHRENPWHVVRVDVEHAVRGDRRTTPFRATIEPGEYDGPFATRRGERHMRAQARETLEDRAVRVGGNVSDLPCAEHL